MNREELKELVKEAVHEALDERSQRTNEDYDTVRAAVPEKWVDKRLIASTTKLTTQRVGVILADLVAWKEIEVAKAQGRGPRPKNVYRLPPPGSR